MIVYVDTSAAIKLVIEERESEALADVLQDHRARGDRLVASLLLLTEMHCAAARRPDALDPDSVRAALSAIDVADLERADLFAAAQASHGLGSADAIHLTVALRVGADAMAVYDRELAHAAVVSGMDVVAPG